MKRRVFSGFRSDEDGSMAVEFVLMLPMLIWALGALYVYVAVFQVRETATKATYTIADLYSRQTDPVDQSFVDQTGNVLAFLAGQGASPAMRVSVIHCAADCDMPDRTLALDWSAGTTGVAGLTEAALGASGIAARVPTIGLGDRVIVVETRFPFVPPLGFGLPPQLFETMMITPPRFAPQLCWETCASGG
ncbi:ABC-type dipeptide transport system, periplasmic component [Rhodovulum sp. P5]|uniref:TadE/TadG family type IV pilus assembly protein n=1 Tax=Rhodovulum sp. P5 TaxID=1564506 RepID=UPI0009C2F68E|nr:pilus assembly protein [Rhodovulum sp. P5]ARE40784.1 ABC-type dipeptide transport system, periplasmic component [Rhodovulum sp. P5]